MMEYSIHFLLVLLKFHLFAHSVLIHKNNLILQDKVVYIVIKHSIIVFIVVFLLINISIWVLQLVNNVRVVISQITHKFQMSVLLLAPQIFVIVIVLTVLKLIQQPQVIAMLALQIISLLVMELVNLYCIVIKDNTSIEQHIPVLFAHQ